MLRGNGYARLARDGIRLFSFSAIVLAFGASCGGAGTPTSTAATTATTSSSTPVIASSTPDPRGSDLAGAAARPPEPEIPADTTPLSARFTPHPLDIPAPRGGRASHFTFDGQHRGWFARMPEGRQNPLTPVYARGRVMVGGGFSSHTFYGLDAHTGNIEWRAAAPDGGPTAAIVEDGKVLYNTESCTLFAVDVETGRQRWSHWLGDPLMGQPAAANGRVFSGHITGGAEGYGFTALSLRTGEPIWMTGMPADVLNAPVLDDTSVYFTTMEGTVWRLDQRTGRIQWRRRLDATSAPWLHDGTLHVTRRVRQASGPNGRRRQTEVAIVLDASNGHTIREHEGVAATFLPTRPDYGGTMTGWEFEGSRPTIVDGRAYQTIGNEVQARDADTGDLLWRRVYTDEVHGRPASSPAIAGSQIVFGTRDGVLYGLDIDTGLTAWAYDVGEPISSQPTVAHGWVYASTTHGGVVGLEVSDASVDGWHMWGGNARHSGPVVGDVAPPEEDERPTEGTLRLGTAPRAGEIAGFPLQGTHVTARVSGFVTRVTVEQEFANPYDHPVEAVYLFPLPQDAAVDAMELRAGDRVVRAHIRRRHEAQEEYRDARERGVLASLLEQERPNLFRQSVANIRPGDSVRVALSYTQALPYEDGSYRFEYPMVAGPRYEPRGGAAAGTTTDHRVPLRGTPPAVGVPQVVLAPGGERPDRVDLSIEADLGVAIGSIESPTHTIDVTRTNDQAARVALREPAAPDRDLEIRFRVAGAAPTVSVMASPPATAADGTVEDGHFALSIHPRLDVPADEVTPRELVFVVDTSSSMNGRPMELARAAMATALHGMRPTDTFRVLGFSDTVRSLSDGPLPATEENVARADEFVRNMTALGATEMISGLRAALEPEGEDGRMRIVLLMTDGYIGNETDVFRAVHDHLGNARVFAFGVGSAVNRYLLSRVAEEGRGDVQVVTLSESPEAAAAHFHERIARPYLTDVSIDWGPLAVHDAYPRRLPDLFADRPLRVHARYTSAARGEITIRGRVAGRPFEQRVPVELPATGGTNREELGSIWARTRIGDLTSAIELQPNAALEEEVTLLGLRHHLLTPWTAFVAVDEGYRVEEAAVRVDEPSQLPAGVTGPPRPEHEASERAPRAGTGTRESPPPMPARISVREEALADPVAPMRSDGPMMGLGGSAGMGQPMAMPEPSEPTPTPTVAVPLGDVATGADDEGGARRHAARGRSSGASGASRCYELATRADGTIDQDALQRCLASLGGGGGAPETEGSAQKSAKSLDPAVALDRRAIVREDE